MDSKVLTRLRLFVSHRAHSVYSYSIYDNTVQILCNVVDYSSNLLEFRSIVPIHLISGTV